MGEPPFSFIKRHFFRIILFPKGKKNKKKNQIGLRFQSKFAVYKGGPYPLDPRPILDHKPTTHLSS
jgi:hypothetical protein